MENNHLYPPIEPYDTGFLKVSDIHTIYYEQSGNPAGIPIVQLHGGPGATSDANHRRFFNPKKYRIILFDQRGCGKSIPMGELQENTTQDLVADMEKIRTHLNIDKWHVCGGSWGSTLALIYAENFAGQISSLMVWSILTNDDWMANWFYGGGQENVFPEEFDNFKQEVLGNNGGELRKSAIDILLRGSEEKQRSLSSIFSRWHLCAMSMLPVTYEPPITEDDIVKEVSGNRLFAHYDENDFFIPENYILENAYKLKNIKGAIVHGRYDLCCPMKAAWQLHKAWPQAEFTVVHNAAHRTEPPLAKAIVEALDKLAG